MSRTPTQKKRPAILATSVAAVVGLGLLFGTPRAAADEYWDGTNTAGSGHANGAGGDGTWDNVTTNWVNAAGTAPHAYIPTDTAHFATTPGTVTLGDNITFTALSFDVDGYTVNQDAGALFSLSPVTGATITVASGATATINAPITGGGSIIVPGPGTLALAGTNSYTGGTTLNGGTLYANNNSAFGTGTLTINGGTIGTTVAGGTSIGNPVVVGGDFSIATDVNAANAGTQNFTFSGTVDLGGTTRTITGVVPGGQITFSNVISNGGVTFNTTSAVNNDPLLDYESFIYSGATANTYTGLTTVAGHSILVLEKSAFDGGIAGNIDVEDNGSIDYINQAGSSNQIADNATVTVNSPGVIIDGGVRIDGLDLRSATDTIGTLNGNSNGAIALGDGTLTVSMGGNFAGVIENGDPNFEGTLVTGGNLVISGTGTLILSGPNTYTGSTTINGATLQISSDQNLGAPSTPLIFNGGILEIAPNSVVAGSGNRPITLNTLGGTVQVDTNSAAEFDGVISGVGQLTKTGPGVLFLGGTDTFTGGTVINGGTLFLTNTGTLVSPVTINNTGTFVLENGGTLTATAVPVTVKAGGTFNNQGTVTSAGEAVVLNDPSGVGTVVNSGTISGTTAAIDASMGGGVTIVNFGTITGPVLLGTGANTIVLATQLRGTPTLIPGGAGNNDTLELAGGDQDSLNLNAATNFEFLTKVGGGLWTVTGTGNFPRGTTIAGGTLAVQGNLNSNVVIEPSGTLAGTGVVTGNVVNSGIVMPGRPSGVLTPIVAQGTLSIRGNYTQNSNGALVIQVNGGQAGQYSQLSIGGHAKLNGSLILQNSSGNGLKFGQKLTILTAGGGVSGTFSDVANPFTGDTIVIGKVVYEPNDVLVEGAQGSFLSIDSQYHLTSNQKTVATALDNAASDPRSAKLLTYLDNRPLKNLPNDFDQIAPEEMTSVFRIGVSLADVQARNIQRRTADLRAGASGFSAEGFQATGGPNYSGGVAGDNGAGGQTASASVPDRRLGTFITGVGDFAHVGDSANASGYDLNTGGVTVGADYKLTDHIAVGVTTGYVGTNANLPSDGRLLVNGGKMGVYGTYYTGGYHADAAVTGGYNSYSTRRSSLQGDAIGNTDGSELNVLADAGYDWKLDALTIGPTAAFQYTYVGIDGFTERGSLSPLRYASQHESSIRSTFGLRMAYDWKVGDVVVRPEGEFAWQHEYGDRDYSVESAFASGAGSMFSVTDTPLGRDSLLFGGGVSVLWNPRTSTYLYYDADLLKKEYYSQSVTGGLRMNF